MNFEVIAMATRVSLLCKSVELRPGELTQVVFIYKKTLCKVSDFFLNISMNAPHLKFLAFLHSENEVKICKIDKMAKNHFSRAYAGSLGVFLGVLGASL